ncbi:MAG: hypothetical protein IKX38_03865 [Bacteroidales bacterium]|nr:hypothetical protein [Bacteroidales bacterium]MBR5720128.1 hypothetical protein [Bacteroidales bacterium]
MKRLVFFFAFVLMSTTMYCQIVEKGALLFLKDEQQLNFDVDFSDAMIDRMSEKEFLDLKCFEEDEGDGWRDYWNTKCRKGFILKFTINANQKTNGKFPRLGMYPEATYTAVYKLVNVDDDGDLKGGVIIKDTKTGEVKAVVKNVFGDGGRFGSIENLIGDAMERAGKSFGRYVSTQM